MLSILCYTLALTAQRQSLNWCFWVKKSAFIRSKRRSVGASSCARTWRPLAAARTNPLTSGGPPGAVLGSLPKAGHGRGGRGKQAPYFHLSISGFSSASSLFPPLFLHIHPSFFFITEQTETASFYRRVCVCFFLWCARACVHGEPLERERERERLLPVP